MKTLALLAALLACSCAPRAIPLPGVPTAPKPSAAVSPAVETVRRESAAAQVTAAKLESQVGKLVDQTADLREDFTAAVTEAERLKAQATADEKELSALWQMLSNSEKKVRNLFTEAEAARESAALHKSQRLAAESNLEALARAAASRDAEVETLRLQRDDMAVTIRSQQESYQKLTADFDKANRQSAVGSYLSGWVRFIGIAVVLVAAVWCFVKFYKPL